METDMYCLSCKENITKENNGMRVTPEGSSIAMYQCDDCHFIEFGYYIWNSLLIF